MKAISASIDRKTVEMDCSAIIETESGIQVTMYVGVEDEKIIERSTGPSFWNADVFRRLTEDEQYAVKKAAEEAVKQLMR